MVTELLGDRGEIPLATQEERSAAENLFSDHPGNAKLFVLSLFFSLFLFLFYSFYFFFSPNIEPDAREFIFRSRIPRPFMDSVPTGQRMYALLTQAEFRLVTAFSTCDEFV